ncbi:enoyl-CoA hydratase/isomerase family protein [Pelomicrobium sp. G1]|uniref:enoyl-CoA hydratase/isomerase family protein n=1 Tax=unclassified Pelomicrobium TaxID=2815318 RepID=UPI003F773D07
MSSPSILLDIDKRGVATLRLNRPEVHNAFDDALIAQLGDALHHLEQDPAVRVVVLAAEGPSFCAGADLQWMRRVAGYTEAQNVEDALKLARVLRRLDALPRPTVARVQGSAFGGGVGLIACCDLAVAARGAQFALSEVRLGLIPATVAPYVVAALGPRQARRYFTTGERFDAETARRLGLVHEVADTPALDQAVEGLVAALLQGAPGAQGAAKRLVADVAGRGLDEALLLETARRIAAARASAEGREGMAAFLEKRAPRWTTRA